MKKSYVIFLTLVALSVCVGGRKPENNLADRFANPPSEVRVSAYWYWLSGHISREGVVRDLHAMKSAGITRAYIGNIGLTDDPAAIGPVTFLSDEWWEITHAALKTATELDIEIGIFNSPGWSQSGGPWVKPSESMRYLASTTTRVEGGGVVKIDLPRPAPKYGHGSADDFQDVRVIAYPADSALAEEWTIVEPESVRHGGNDVSMMFDTGKPMTVRSVRIFAATSVNSPARLEAKVGGEFRTLAKFDISRFNSSLSVGFDPDAPVVVSVPATTAAEFRLVIGNMPPGKPFGRVSLCSAPSVESFPEKTLAKMYQTPLPYWHEYMWRDQPVLDAAAPVVDPADVLDISGRFDGRTLVWEVPAGDWIVMRTGMMPTGVENSPAPREGRGPEADKMSREHIASHFDAFIGEILRRVPAADRASFKVVVADSYETGSQNFTDTFLADFEERYGYSAVPFLPVYSGVVVGSQDISDRFLWDVRRLVADKVAYDYVGGLREICHRYGLTTWLENYGHWGFPGEFLQYGGQSDEIGGEFWSEGDLGDIENRAASSAGHIYGKKRIYAESFTAGGGAYHRHPAMMKQRGDRFFTEGINSTLLHVVVSQPYEEHEPGVNTWFGNEFNRKNTWYPHMHLFTEYLRRVNFMLQQGLNVADAAYFIGEDAPKMTGVTDPALPRGYQFDYINAEVLVRDAFVKDGMLTLPHGTSYRILVLPKLETMRPEVVEKLEKLIHDGAVVLGPAPRRSPSLAGYPLADARVSSTARRLWSQIDPVTKYARIGRGTLIDGMNMAQAFALIGCPPDMSTDAGDPVLYGHRSVEGVEIYFVSNQSSESITVAPEFRVTGLKPELWDAISGSIADLPWWRATASGTVVPLRLAPSQSVFVVFRDKAPKAPKSAPDANRRYARQLAAIDSPWSVTFETYRRGPAEVLTMDSLRDLTASDDFDVKHYSGLVEYTNTFSVGTPPRGRVWLDLGELSAMAKVWVNGHYAGGVWTAPHRVDITGLISARGENSLRIELSTTWLNRIVGDTQLPEAERHTWLQFQPWGADTKTQPSGLRGPVTLLETEW
jgi:hypothetical protein